MRGLTEREAGCLRMYSTPYGSGGDTALGDSLPSTDDALVKRGCLILFPNLNANPEYRFSIEISEQGRLALRVRDACWTAGVAV